MNKHNIYLPPRIILWGGTGQAKVVRTIIEHHGSKVVAVFDDTPNLPSPFSDVPLYFSWIGFQKWLTSQNNTDDVGFCITIGNPHGRIRLKLHDQMSKAGLTPTTIIHPTAWIADNAIIGEGSQIMAGAVIQPNANIGDQCIINGNVYIDHDTVIGDGSELVAGSQLMGLSKIGQNTLIGASSVILSRITIGNDVCIGAGIIASNNVADNTTIINNGNRPQ